MAAASGSTDNHQFLCFFCRIDDRTLRHQDTSASGQFGSLKLRPYGGIELSHVCITVTVL